MTTRRPTSFNIFIAVISIIALVFVIAYLFSYYHVDKKYTIILALFMFIDLAFSTVGIYTGFKYKTEEHKAKILNRIGFVGNLLIFLFVLSIMTIAALTTA